MKVEDSGLLQNVEVNQNSGLSVIAYQALNIFQRIFLQYAIDIATIYTILKALIYSRYIRFTEIQIRWRSYGFCAKLHHPKIWYC